MRSLQNRQKRTGWKKVLFSKFTGVFLVFAVIFMTSVVWHMYEHYQDTKEKMLAASAKFASVAQQQNDLEQKITNLQSKSGVEAELRKKFMVAKDGEHVLVLVDQKTATNTPEETPKKESWWKSFLSVFR
ncbi:MAG TPA: septum formation initiator family protein [Candidatus Paceibacterota bacterium]|nr:septum formation initiator family protein [Candidatus Paceibacterota bacterium]